MTAIGPYEVLGELGRGGMGAVFRARAPGGREVAVKVLARAHARPDAIERFEREARLQARLGGDGGFVPVLDAGATAEALYLVMPLLSGGTLRDRIARGPFAVGESVELATRLARAVGRAHAEGIVHRDLKPENILFDAEGRALIADLGLAKHFRHDVEGASRSVALSKTGEVRGTVGYFPPEQLRDAARAGPAADVFALGAILHEMLAGEPAFVGGSAIELLARIESGERVPLTKARPDVPRWLDRAITRCLERKAEDRFADGAALASALVAPAAARRSWVAPAVVVVAVAAAAVFLVTRGRGEAAPEVAASPARAPVTEPAASPAELIAAARRGDGELERAAKRAGRVAASDELDRALVEGLASARKRSWSAATQTLATIERSGVAHGAVFNVATLALVREGVDESLAAGRFDAALSLVQGAAALELRHARALDGDLLLDRFYGPAMQGLPVVPRDRWFEVMVACLRLDVALEPPHIDVTDKWTVSRRPDLFESYLAARLAYRYHPDPDTGKQLELASTAALASPEQVGARVRSMVLVGISWGKPEAEKIDAMRRAVELDPESAFRREELGLALDDTGHHREAVEHFEKAIEMLRAQSPRPLSRVETISGLERRIRDITVRLEKNP